MVTTEAGLGVVGVRLAEGRSGSTLLMRLLGTSPHVVFDPAHPAESRLLSYLVRMAEQMTEPFDADLHPGATPFFFGERPTWGPVPFRTDLVALDRLRPALLGATWSALSAEVLDGRPGARWYAEKLAVPVEAVLAAGIELRVVDLLRDPRDVLASARAFTATDVAEPGLADGRAAPGQVERFVDAYEAALRPVVAGPAQLARRVVRYEDLVSDLEGVAARLGDWLGVELDAEAARRPTPELAAHRTSATPDASVGRWRDELAAGEAEVVAARLGPMLEPFGYDLG